MSTRPLGTAPAADSTTAHSRMNSNASSAKTNAGIHQLRRRFPVPGSMAAPLIFLSTHGGRNFHAIPVERGVSRVRGHCQALGPNSVAGRRNLSFGNEWRRRHKHRRRLELLARIETAALAGLA